MLSVHAPLTPYDRTDLPGWPSSEPESRTDRRSSLDTGQTAG